MLKAKSFLKNIFLIVFIIGLIPILQIKGNDINNSISLEYSTYLGGNGTEGWGFLDFDNSGNCVLSSNTDSTNFLMKNAIQTMNMGERDRICLKLDKKGENILYSSYYGGSGDDFLSEGTIDSQGNMILVGVTSSLDFPLVNALVENQSSYERDVFVYKLSSDGQTVIFSTYIGSASDYYSISVTTDSNDNIIITGSTIATDFLVENAYQENKSGATDAFITKITSDGQNVVFSTYFGGTNDDQIKRVTVDKNDNIIVIGVTSSSEQFPIKNAQNPQKSSSEWDVFLSKFSSDGQELIFSTFYGGTRPWGPTAVKCDSNNNIIAAGETNSQGFPVVNAFQEVYGEGQLDSFLSKLSSDGQEIAFSIFIGGIGSEGPIGLTTDSKDNIFLTGATNSYNFVIKNFYQAEISGGWDGYLLACSQDGQDLLFSSYFGGSGSDYSTSIVLIPDLNDSFLIAGHGDSRNLDLVNPYQESYGGGVFDLFICRFGYGEINYITKQNSTPGFELMFISWLIFVYLLKKKKN
ncbi:MAG: SBBP repeat-containing protein [Candidatus Hodarchaeota archaeon]